MYNWCKYGVDIKNKNYETLKYSKLFWNTIVFELKFCEAVMLVKKEASRVRVRTSSRPSRRGRRIGDRETISVHRNHGPADAE